MTTENLLHCSFCGKNQNEVRKLIAGPTVFICDECVDLCVDIIREEDIRIPSRTGAVPTPTEIFNGLIHDCGGQEHATKALSHVLHKHCKAMADEAKTGCPDSSSTSILLCGPSLSRSEIARALRKHLGIPFVVLDTASLIEDQNAPQTIARELLEAANYYARHAEYGIVYIDDFDQLGRLAKSPSGAGFERSKEVQSALFELLMGAVVEVPVRYDEVLSVDTVTIMFIFAGRDFGLSQSVTTEGENRARDPAPDNLESDAPEEHQTLPDAQAHTLVEFGLLPDLVNCLSTIVQLENPQRSG